jgi:signal transduction histidine kinase
VREIADCVKGIVAEPTFELADLNQLVESVSTPLRMVAERQELTIDLTGLDRFAPLVPIDQKQMYNCVYNLINNAIPETPPGGRIAVRTRVDRGQDYLEGEEHLVVEVADTGKGMPEHVRAKLFTKDAVSTKPGGTGLGTRIVRNVVAAHGGEITVASEQGIGTTFTIRLPLRREDVPAAAEGAAR